MRYTTTNAFVQSLRGVVDDTRVLAVADFYDKLIGVQRASQGMISTVGMDTDKAKSLM